MGYQFIMPKQVFYGENALSDGAASICALGKKALVVTDPMMVKLGNAKLVTDMLSANGVDFVIFDGITGEPTDKMIDAGLAVYKNDGTFVSVYGSISQASRCIEGYSKNNIAHMLDKNVKGRKGYYFKSISKAEYLRFTGVKNLRFSIHNVA